MTPTSKDIARVEALLKYVKVHGLAAAERKAANDAEKIHHLQKCEARSYLLRRALHASLAAPFDDRAQWLRAQGVVA